MSNFNTITSLAESPKQEGLLYAGTDDGLIQVSEDGGEHWKAIPVGKLPGVPKHAFVNNLRADLFDPDTVYVALDNHKTGDFKPYLLKSTDRGRSWKSIVGDLGDRHIVWRVVQDHVQPGLLFAATEFGIFFTVDRGKHWTKLSANTPTIAFRDLAIQRRENDLVGASFGRGFWVLDDYAPLRSLTPKALHKAALLFAPSRPTWWYIERRPLGGDKKASQGDAYYTADNPPFGAVFTYYMAKDLKSRKERRQAREKDLIKAGKDTPYPGWEGAEAERREPKPAMLLTVRDSDGNVVRRISSDATQRGFHRVAWDLRFPASRAVGAGGGPFGGEPRGFLAAPGRYSVDLAQQVDGKTTQLAGPSTFEVKRMRHGALPGAEPKTTVAFWKRLASDQRAVTAAQQVLKHTQDKVKDLHTALARSNGAPGELDQELYAIEQELYSIEEILQGNQAKAAIGEPDRVTVSGRLQEAMIGTAFSTYGPTPTHRKGVEIAESEFKALRARMNELTRKRIPAYEDALLQAGAPWVKGAPIPKMR